jgi:Flp pilus assembly protein TadB
MMKTLELDLKIDDAFYAAWDEFGDDKSTEFLITITADRCGVSYERAVAALERMALLAEKDKQR